MGGEFLNPISCPIDLYLNNCLIGWESNHPLPNLDPIYLQPYHISYNLQNLALRQAISFAKTLFFFFISKKDVYWRKLLFFLKFYISKRKLLFFFSFFFIYIYIYIYISKRKLLYAKRAQSRPEKLQGKKKF